MNQRNSRRRQTQKDGVQRILRRNAWVSLQDFRGVKGTDSAKSARIRELRSKKHGAHKVLCVRGPDAVYRYRLVK